MPITHPLRPKYGRKKSSKIKKEFFKNNGENNINQKNFIQEGPINSNLIISSTNLKFSEQFKDLLIKLKQKAFLRTLIQKRSS